MSTKKKWVSFDPTVHLGHLITTCGVIFSALGLYYSLVNRINLIEDSVMRDAKHIEEVKRDYKHDFEKLSDQIDRWFIRIEDKIDKKADKRQ